MKIQTFKNKLITSIGCTIDFETFNYKKEQLQKCKLELSSIKKNEFFTYNFETKKESISSNICKKKKNKIIGLSIVETCTELAEYPDYYGTSKIVYTKKIEYPERGDTWTRYITFTFHI